MTLSAAVARINIEFFERKMLSLLSPEGIVNDSDRAIAFFFDMTSIMLTLRRQRFILLINYSREMQEHFSGLKCASF